MSTDKIPRGTGLRMDAGAPCRGGRLSVFWAESYRWIKVYRCDRWLNLMAETKLSTTPLGNCHRQPHGDLGWGAARCGRRSEPNQTESARTAPRPPRSVKQNDADGTIPIWRAARRGRRSEPATTARRPPPKIPKEGVLELSMNSN